VFSPGAVESSASCLSCFTDRKLVLEIHWIGSWQGCRADSSVVFSRSWINFLHYFCAAGSNKYPIHGNSSCWNGIALLG